MVAELFKTVVTAVGLFAGTNVDDVIILSVWFLAGRASGSPKPWQIWAGQAGGFAALVAVSVLAALGLRVVPERWVGLLGFVPLALGAWGLVKAVRAHRGGEQPKVAPAGGLAAVAMLTIVNGADNLAVYPPVFRTIGVGASVVTIVVFFAGVAAYCLLGSWLGSHRHVIAVIERWGHWIVPGVFVAIGAVILISSGVLSRIL